MDLLLKILISLFAAYVLCWFIARLRLGPKALITDEDHARDLALTEIWGFQAIEAAISSDGHAAVARDQSNWHVLIWAHGARFSARRIGPLHVAERRDGALRFQLGEPGLNSIMLDLGDAAARWERSIKGAPPDA